MQNDDYVYNYWQNLLITLSKKYDWTHRNLK